MPHSISLDSPYRLSQLTSVDMPNEAHICKDSKLTSTSRRIETGVVTIKISLEVSHKARTRSDILYLGIFPKGCISYYRDTSVFTTAVFIIAWKWKQPRYPSTDEWIVKMWYIYISLHLQRKTKLWNTKWMKLEIITLSELTQTKIYLNFRYMCLN